MSASLLQVLRLILFAAEEVKSLWLEYENNASLEASLVKDFDKVITCFCHSFSHHFDGTAWSIRQDCDAHPYDTMLFISYSNDVT